jgi:hypothetical protein
MNVLRLSIKNGSFNGIKALLDKLRAKETHTGDIAAGPVEACNKVKLDGIAGCAEYDGE